MAYSWQFEFYFQNNEISLSVWILVLTFLCKQKLIEDIIFCLPHVRRHRSDRHR